MRLRSVVATSLFAALPAVAQNTPAAAPQAGSGFFKPSPDPALTSIRPATIPAPRIEQPKPVDMAVEIRKAEEARRTEAQMDRSQQEHERTRVEATPIAADAAPPPPSVVRPPLTPLTPVPR